MIFESGGSLKKGQAKEPFAYAFAAYFQKKKLSKLSIIQAVNTAFSVF